MKNQDSFATSHIKHHRNIALMMVVAPLVVLGLVVGSLYIGNRNSEDTYAAQVAGMPPYDPSAIFNTPIPNNYPTDARSSSVASKFYSVISNNNYTGLFFGISGEVPALNKANNSSPLYSWSTGNGSGTFRVNSNAVVGSGSDHPTILLNTDTQQELRIWRASINHGSKTISGSLSGLFYFNNDGAIKNPNGSRSVSIPYSGGGAGNGLSYYGGMITRDDWNSGVIRHALRIAYNNCSFNGGTWRIPATKSDQPNGCTSAGSTVGMDMGMILQLSDSVDCNSRTSPTGNANATKLVRMVCKAMQDYGVMISDGTGASAVFYMEDNLTAKWGELIPIPSTGHYGSIFRNPSGTNGIPWNQFRVVAKPSSYTSWGAGTPAPTPPPPTPTPPSPSPSPNPSPGPTAKPVAPTGLKLTPGDSKLVVTWNASPSSEAVDSYQVYLNGSYSYSTTASPTYTITGTPGQTYSVRVSAHNVNGYGPWTPSESGVIGSPPGTPAPTPTPAPSPPPPLPPIEVPDANPTKPVPIPTELPVEEDGTIVADFNGDGLNEVVKDTNNDGSIDPKTEIVVDGTTNPELTDTTQTPISATEYAASLYNLDEDLETGNESSTVTFQAGPLPSVSIPKPVAYTFLTAGIVTTLGMSAYIALTKLAIFAGIRGKLGL